MELKAKPKHILIIMIWMLVVACTHNSNERPKWNNSFYRSAILGGMKYYNDSISSSTAWYTIEAYVANIDTTNGNMKVMFDYSWGTPWPYFNCTHIYKDKETIYTIRFNDSISRKLITSLNFKFIDSTDITFVNSLKEKYLPGMTITGHTSSFLLNINNYKVGGVWYEPSELAPRNLSIIDEAYLQSDMNYSKFLERKRKEYLIH